MGVRGRGEGGIAASAADRRFVGASNERVVENSPEIFYSVPASFDIGANWILLPNGRDGDGSGGKAVFPFIS